MSLTPVLDNFSPLYSGDTLQPFKPQFAQVIGGVLQAYNLSGLTLSLKMVNADNGTVHVGAGTWTIDNASGGQAHYVFDATDVATPGLWTMFVKLTNGSGAAVHALTKVLEILPAP